MKRANLGLDLFQSTTIKGPFAMPSLTPITPDTPHFSYKLHSSAPFRKQTQSKPAVATQERCYGFIGVTECICLYLIFLSFSLPPHISLHLPHPPLLIPIRWIYSKEVTRFSKNMAKPPEKA